MRLDNIISVTSGKLHCWVNTPIGAIRKPNEKIPQELWDIFWGKTKIAEMTKITHPMVFIPFPEIKWYNKLWLKLKKMFLKIFGIRLWQK